MILEKIAQATRKRVELQKLEIPEEIIKEQALKMENTKEYPFEKALKGPEISFICEVKKASPSKGVIAKDFPYLEIAKEYELAGASAISVLTEPEFFLGKNEYLQEIASTVSIPVLRKDFIVDAYQIYEAKLLGASAILLICAILDQDTLNQYFRIADDLGLSVLVEAHSKEEVDMALECGARVIGVNNRNLKDFTVDITNSRRLRKLVGGDKVFVSESGIRTPEDIDWLRKHQVDAVLIGEAFMRSRNKKAELEHLRSVEKHTKVKMCGLTRIEDIEYANELLPDYVGFVFAKSRRQVDKKKAYELRQRLDNKVATVGVFVDEKTETMVELVKEGIIDCIQLHGHETNEVIQKIKQEITAPIIKAFSIEAEEDLLNIENCEADYLLFDYKNGGTGKCFDWSLLENQKIKKPFFLAGGISTQNAAEAIQRFHPYGIDMSSALESDGVKDFEKMKQIMEIVNEINTQEES